MRLHYYDTNGGIATPESGVAFREFVQTVATDTWTFEHQMNRIPDFQCFTDSMRKIHAVPINITKTSISVKFGTARTGKMYLY